MRAAAASAAARIAADIAALPMRTTADVRAVRREHSRALHRTDAAFVIEVARRLLASDDRLRWVACELVRHHNGAFQAVDCALLAEFGRGMASWDAVDGFARTLSGPAWQRGIVEDALIYGWAQSPNLWWRRAALVSTVALNMRSHGGAGDARRTLAVCRMLAADREDMVQKAMSWALRELIVHDAAAVRQFLADHDVQLAARVKREVNHKLATGLKSPRRAPTRMPNS